MSLLNESLMARHSFFVKGHSNMVSVDADGKKKGKVKVHAEAVRAEDHIRLQHMEVLMQKWREAGGSLDKSDFRSTFKEVIGETLGERFEEHVTFLFKKMDTNQDQVVDWDEFCTYMMVGLQEKVDLDSERENPVLVCPVLFETQHRSAIVRVLSAPAPSRFLTIGEDGHMLVWSMKLKLNASIKLDEVAFSSSKSLRVTDADILSNAFRVVLATTNRDIRLYHSVSGIPHQRIAFPHIIMSLQYSVSTENADNATLVLGDMAGYVTVLKFNQATSKLFNETSANPRAGNQQRILLKDITKVKKGSNMKSRVTWTRAQTHYEEGANMLNQSVHKVMYIPKLDGVFSCATTDRHSLVFYDVSKNMTRNFNIPKGCLDFDFYIDREDGHSIVATGGNDCNLRFWNPYVPSHPSITLTGHRSPIVHVMFNSSRKQIITVTDQEVIKIWHVQQRVCLNTLGNIIPHKLIQANIKVTKSYWHDASQSLLICKSTEMVCVTLSRENSTATHITHDMPITVLSYVKEFNLVVTGCSGGHILCWDLSSGGRTIEYDSAHDSAVSALEVGYGGRRLISGASSGEIFVWNTLSGLVLIKLEQQKPAEVTGIVSTRDRIFSVGWGGKLVSFLTVDEVDVAQAPMFIQQDRGWDGKAEHKDDIMAMHDCGGTLLATGSYDGEVLIWNLKLQQCMQRFDSKTFRKRLYASGGEHEHVPAVASNARLCVDAVLWLKYRIHQTRKVAGTAAATLVVSSDGGCIHFWNAMKPDLLGAFFAVPDNFGTEAVVAMTSDEKNETLITGDSLGSVRVYDIASYCLSGADRKQPKILREWRAHVQGISSIEFVEEANVVITGSADQSVRVWGRSDGNFIGCFGGDRSWSLPISGSPSMAGYDSERRRSSVISNSDVLPPISPPPKQILEEDNNDEMEFPNKDVESDNNEDEDEIGELNTQLKQSPSSTSQTTKKASNTRLKSRRDSVNDALFYSAQFKLPEIASKTSIAEEIDEPLSSEKLQTRMNNMRTPKPTVLGKAYKKKVSDWHVSRESWRNSNPRPDISKTQVKGLMVCVPYNTLRLEDMEEVTPRRVPSSVTRSRERLQRFTRRDSKKDPEMFTKRKKSTLKVL
eukprot:m.78601 g.78601  ORF g.78601 m.78601 type:complete len:1109 (+) comp12678_c0_seq2:542-3868(+)